MLIRRENPGSGQRSFVSRILKSVLRHLTPKPPSVKKGRENEKLALMHAKILYKTGRIPHLQWQQPYLTRPYSKLDRRGIDLVVPTDYGDIGIQIKSSWRGKQAFIEYGVKYPNLPTIPCVVVNDGMREVDIREDLRRACWSEYYALQERKQAGRT